MIHVPIPHAVAFSDEKIRADAAALMLIRDNTTIPVPEVCAWSTSADNPTGYGPLIVMEYIEHTQSLENIIRDHIKTAGSSSPKKGLTDSKLLKTYHQMANIMLQMSIIEDPSSSAKVGISSRSTLQSQSRISRVHRRPISQSISDLVISGGIPPSVLPPTNKTYSTSDEYYQAIADLYLTHLTLQHNNAVTSSPDGRVKYVPRQLSRKLAREGRLARDEDVHDNTTAGKQKEVFKLCWRYRLGDVYLAPASFHDEPPWWLIINKPEFFEKSISAWVKECERHLPSFLEAVELEEAKLRETEWKKKDGLATLDSDPQLLAIDEAAEDGRPSTLMSKRMKRNWENGKFFVDHCTRRNYGSDPFYWKYMDKKSFGKNKTTGLLLKRGAYRGRLHLHSDGERAQTELFIAWKLEDREDKKVLEWDEEDAKAALEACLSGTLGDMDIPKPRVIPWTMTDHPDSP